MGRRRQEQPNNQYAKGGLWIFLSVSSPDFQNISVVYDIVVHLASFAVPRTSYSSSQSPQPVDSLVGESDDKNVIQMQATSRNSATAYVSSIPANGNAVAAMVEEPMSFAGMH